MRVAGAQIHNVVGDLDGNVDRVAEAMRWAEEEGADVLVVPELALTGYPLGDLTHHRQFIADAEDALRCLVRDSGRMTSVISTVDRVPPQRSWDTRERDVAIVAKIISGGEVRGTYHKCLLPTYGVYDEGRNIAPGRSPGALWRIGDVIAGVSICEDIWSGDGPPEAQSAAGAQILLVPNASPYHMGRNAARLSLVQSVARRNGLPLVYLNFFGGQDDIVFDGGSLVVNAEGGLLHRAAEFKEDRFCIDVPVAAPRTMTGPATTIHTRRLEIRSAVKRPEASEVADDLTGVWSALVIATRDFVRKNGFPGVVFGLSGGIDAAVTAAVATDAIGPGNVLGIAMPGEKSPKDDQRDAEIVAANLGIDFAVIPISSVEESLISATETRLGERGKGSAERVLEDDAGLDELIDEGFDPQVSKWVLRLIDDAEFLRRRAPLGIRVTAKAFGQDRRMPLSNSWRPSQREAPGK
ncbi:MAG: nitrilase-related carbon-nitrogen hydrolase [Opitutales bacterium]